jgi:hypothetical protein
LWTASLKHPGAWASTGGALWSTHRRRDLVRCLRGLRVQGLSGMPGPDTAKRCALGAVSTSPSVGTSIGVGTLRLLQAGRLR